MLLVKEPLKLIKTTESPINLSTQTLKRMPFYHHYLKDLYFEGAKVIAAPAIAAYLDLNEVQVRKDLAAISSQKGKPKSGFIVEDLLYNLEILMGYHSVKEAVLIGVGSLGKTLLSYKEFDNYGMHIVTGFDIDRRLIGLEVNGKRIMSMDKLSSLCEHLNIQIGIITVPAREAQTVCDQLVESGIRAIWNFAPIHLSTPNHVFVHNENMPSSVALLSHHLNQRTSAHK